MKSIDSFHTDLSFPKLSSEERMEILEAAKKAVIEKKLICVVVERNYIEKLVHEYSETLWGVVYNSRDFVNKYHDDGGEWYYWNPQQILDA